MERVLASKPPFPRGLSWLAGDRSPGFRGWSAAPSRGIGVLPSGWRTGRPRLPWPGHSGGTAPASHRTSLDHRPYVEASLSSGGVRGARVCLPTDELRTLWGSKLISRSDSLGDERDHAAEFLSFCLCCESNAAGR